MLLSLCMIVKNEEKVLGRCLDSVKGLVDEIIVVDTGSEDRTKDIARQYTRHVYDFEWVNDFAAARNESLRHATGQWILVMDADEYAAPGQQETLRKKLSGIKPNQPLGVLVKIMNFHGANGEHIHESSGPRLFTNRQGIRYREPIHEQLTSPKGEITYVADSFTLVHTGYTVQAVAEKNKGQRNMVILQSMESESKLRDPYFCFVLGNEYYNTGDLERTYSYYKKAMEQVDRSAAGWYDHLLNNISQTALKTGRFREAHQYISEGKQLWPDRVDYHCLEGTLYEGFGFYQRAEQAFQECLRIVDRSQATGKAYWLIEESYGQRVPREKLAGIAKKRGDLQQMVYHLTALLKLDRQSFASLRTLLRTLAAHDSTDSVQTFMSRMYPLSDPKNAYIMLRVSLLEGLGELAGVYWNACQEHRVPLTYEDELAFCILQKKEAQLLSDKQIESPLALLASFVYSDSRYAALASDQNGLLDKLIRQLSESGAEEQAASRSSDEYALLTQLIVQLLQYGYSGEYEQLVNRFADEELLHRLAEQLNALGYENIAVELYSILLDNNLLRGEGYKELGSYCFLNGNPQKGLQFMVEAVQLAPSIKMLGLVLENSKGLDTSEFMLQFSKWVKLDEIPMHTVELLTK
ncbi:TPR domain-containing glycosyltransferase [Cohnella lubricantis]|uniref:Glycosyltransferase n=1 Tax=Cohnella lubricantis TaxID=2163172 RepID=A0A841T8Z1_9BACL|nr:TPR domain-containing glycosyltransferase [Cohnella lubricantis]MBB6677402.1 glycosyltransferase [Cohnella lubricantis]MBP2118707.1 glycosyltransferase involved in cell wall biosynthesis [Cohnella lubricantis]